MPRMYGRDSVQARLEIDLACRNLSRSASGSGLLVVPVHTIVINLTHVTESSSGGAEHE